MKKGTFLTKKQRDFLIALPKYGLNESKAAAAAGITYHSIWEAKTKNQAFIKAYNEVKEADKDEAEEMHKYLRKGIPKVEAVGGKLVQTGWVKEPDRMAIEFFLKYKCKERGYVLPVVIGNEDGESFDITLNIR